MHDQSGDPLVHQEGEHLSLWQAVSQVLPPSMLSVCAAAMHFVRCPLGQLLPCSSAGKVTQYDCKHVPGHTPPHYSHLQHVVAALPYCL